MDIIQFVDSISASPTVRLDLNDGTTWGVNYDGTDFSPPPLKTSWANTLLADGERLAAAAYANRTITLALDLIGTVEDQASELQTLWRELNRATNFLKWHPTGASNPVFFRTIRSSNTKVTDYPSGSIRSVQVTIDAEPFAYGVKVQLPEVTVVNDTAPPSNIGTGMYFDVTSPQGDVETPLYLSVLNDTSTSSGLVRTASAGPPLSLVAVRRRNDPTATPFYVEAESMTFASNTKPRRDQDSTADLHTGGPMSINATDAFTTGVTNWTGVNCTVAWVVATDPDASTSPSMRITPNGTSPQVYAESERVPVTAGKNYIALVGSLWSSTTRIVDVHIRWFAGGNWLSTTTFSESLTANTWADLQGYGTAPANATQASIAIGMSSTPPASNVLYVQAAKLVVGPLNANHGFEVNASNWTATGGTLVRQTSTVYSGVAAGQFTPNGATATCTVESEQVAVIPGRAYSATARIRNAVARSVSTVLSWYTAGTSLISSETVSTSLSAGSWTAVEVSGVAPATAAFATIKFSMTGTPPGSNVLHLDQARVDPSTHARIDLAGLSSWTTALSGTFPPTASADARGTYRVFMRYAYATSGTVSSNDVRLRWGGKEAVITNPEIVELEKNGTTLKYADLGLVQVPGGYDPVEDGVSGVDVATEGIYFELQVKDNEGTFVDLDIDHFLFAPADDRLLLIKWATTIGSVTEPTSMLLDSLAGQVYGRNASGQIHTLPGTELAGGAPMVIPGVTNRIFFCLDVGRATNITTSRSVKTRITPHYWPRYLTVRAAAS